MSAVIESLLQFRLRGTLLDATIPGSLGKLRGNWENEKGLTITPNIRILGSLRWKVADLAQDLQSYIASDPLVHNLFKGATSLDQVVIILTNLVLVENPALGELDHGIRLQILSVGLRFMVIKSLDQGPLTQTEHLIGSMARHFADKECEPPLGESCQTIATQMLGLYGKWNTQMRQQRASQRNMMSHN